MNKQINSRWLSGSTAQLLKEYKPAILFLLRFLGVYVIGNIVYGLWIESYGTVADPITQLVSVNSAYFLKSLGLEAAIVTGNNVPNVALQLNGTTVVNVYEGCNAINVSILFVAFLFAYKTSLLRTLIYSFLGLLAIYFFNILRVAGLFIVANYFPDTLYLMHKFVFTGIIYALVFFLWYLWVAKFSR